MIETPADTADTWDLTAPESVVLRDGPSAKPSEVIKLAVLELVTRRVLRLVEVQTRDWRGRPKAEVVIGVGSRPAPADGPLAIVADVALTTKAQRFPDGTVGLRMATFAQAFAKKNGRGALLYIPRSVLPSLEARGLFTKTRRKILGIVPTTDWTRTAGGDQALARLAALTSTAEHEAREWSERDPRRLATFLGTAGGAALLATAAYPVFDDFARRLRTTGDDGTTAAIVTTTSVGDDDPAGDSVSDFGGLDFSALGIDFSGFAGLDQTFAAIDAGIADAGGDGGGDGGGGGD